MDSSHPALDFENLAVTDFQGLVSPIQVQPTATRKMAQAKRKPVTIPKPKKPHSPQRKRVMVRKTMTLPSTPYELGSIANHENLPPHSPRRKTRKVAVLPPSPEMKKLPSTARSASPDRIVKKVGLSSENVSTAKEMKSSLLSNTKTTVITPQVASNFKPVRPVEKSSADAVNYPAAALAKRKDIMKPEPAPAPVEKLQTLQALLNSKETATHVPKKAKKSESGPPVVIDPSSIKKIDPERAAKGKQYIKERKALELKKKRLLKEQEMKEKEKVAMALKKIEDLRKEQRELVRKAKLNSTAKELTGSKNTKVPPSAMPVNPLPIPSVPQEATKINTPLPDPKLSQYSETKLKFSDALPAEIQPGVTTEQVVPMTDIPARGSGEKSAGIPTRNSVEAVPASVKEIEPKMLPVDIGGTLHKEENIDISPNLASIRKTDSKPAISKVTVNYTQDAPSLHHPSNEDEKLPLNSDSVKQNPLESFTSNCQLDIAGTRIKIIDVDLPPDIDEKINLSKSDKDELEEKLIKMQKSFAVVSERLVAFEEALGARVPQVTIKHTTSHTDTLVSNMANLITIKKEEIPSNGIDIIKATPDFNDIGVRNMSEFSKKRKGLEKLHEAALKIQVFYKKQKLRRNMVRKSNLHSPNRATTKALKNNPDIQELLRKVAQSHGSESDRAKQILNSEQFKFRNVERLGSPVINITNYLGLSTVSKHEDIPSLSNRTNSSEKSLQPEKDNLKAQEEIPFVIPKNFKHSIVNLYTKYIARNSSEEVLCLKMGDESKKVSESQKSLNPDSLTQLPGENSSVIFKMNEEVVSAAQVIPLPGNFDDPARGNQIHKFISKEIQTDLEISEVSDISETPIKSYSAISSKGSYSNVNPERKKSLIRNSVSDYDNESFESIPSNLSHSTPSSPPLKPRPQTAKPFYPGDVFARQRGLEGFNRLAPQALGKKFDLEFQSFADVDFALQQVLQMQTNRSAAISNQENAALANLYLRQEQIHAAALERAKQKRSNPEDVPESYSKKSYDESFESVSDIPQPRVFSRSSPSRPKDQTDSESIEELIEASVKAEKILTPTIELRGSKHKIDSIEELIHGATSYTPLKQYQESQKTEKVQTLHNNRKEIVEEFSPIEFQLKLKLDEIKKMDNSPHIKSILNETLRSISPASESSSISEYLPKNSEDISEQFLRDKSEGNYDSDSFYSVESDPSLSSSKVRAVSANEKNIDVKKVAEEGRSDLEIAHKPEFSQKQTSDLDHIRAQLSASFSENPPPNKLPHTSFHRGTIDFDTLSESIKEIGDDLSSFQEQILKAVRSPSRTLQRVSSPEKSVTANPEHPMAIATAENNEKIQRLQQDLLYWESKRKLDELNERLRVAKEGQLISAPVVQTHNSLVAAEKIGSQVLVESVQEHRKDQSIILHKETLQNNTFAGVDKRANILFQPGSLDPDSKDMDGQAVTRLLSVPLDNIEKSAVKDIEVINESLDLLKGLPDPTDTTSDFISEDFSGIEEESVIEITEKPVEVTQINTDTAPVISSIAEQSTFPSTPLIAPNEVSESIYKPDFEEFRSSTTSATPDVKILDVEQSFSKFDTTDKFVLNVVDAGNCEQKVADPVAKTSNSSDINLSIKMISFEIVDNVTESIFSDLLVDTVNVLLSSKLQPPPNTQMNISPAAASNVPMPFSAEISISPEEKLLDYNRILADGCECIIQFMQKLLPVGSSYWDPPAITVNMIPDLSESIRRLLVDVTNEALYEQFEKQRFYDDPRTRYYQKRTIKPAKVRRDVLLEGCATRLENWRLHSVKHGTNLDALLIETVKIEGKILCNILNDEVLVKTKLFEEIWNDLIEDTAQCVLDVNLM